MKKIVRILGLINIIVQKKHYTKSIRFQLIRILLFLEYKSYFQKSRTTKDTVSTKILHYSVLAYGYKNLCLLFTEIFIHEEYQYFSSLNDAPIIVDCGANIGMATLYLKWRFPKAVIHAFEPDPTAFKLLSRNVDLNNLQSVLLYNKAAMTHSGTLDFYISSETKASLMASTLQGRMDELKITVEGIDFPAFINETKPNLLKIDIEGAEKTIFQRMDQTNSFDCIDQIIMEYHHKIDSSKADFSKMLTLVEKNGFDYNMITQFNRKGEFQDILVYCYR